MSAAAVEPYVLEASARRCDHTVYASDRRQNGCRFCEGTP